MSKIGSQEFQEHSEVDLFNKIGFIAETLGYHPVYFKALKPMLMETENGFKMGEEYIHYIHLYKGEYIKISIYYDKYNLWSMFPEEPYYELYDKCDVERFLDTEEDRSELLNRLKELLD